MQLTKKIINPILQNSFSSFKLSKPLVIGEFAAESSEHQSIESLMDYAYSNGYAVSGMNFLVLQIL